MIATGEIASSCPDSGRRTTIVAALEMLHERMLGGPCTIVEVGTVRDARPVACTADGWATRIWGWYAAQVNGRCVSIDVDPAAIRIAEGICAPWLPWLDFIVADAREVMPGFATLDLLYMDGPPEAAIHLAIYRALSIRPPLILFDDILDSGYRVKGETAIPAMLQDGYALIFNRERQALLALP